MPFAGGLPNNLRPRRRRATSPDLREDRTITALAELRPAVNPDNSPVSTALPGLQRAKPLGARPAQPSLRRGAHIEQVPEHIRRRYREGRAVA